MISRRGLLGGAAALTLSGCAATLRPAFQPLAFDDLREQLGPGGRLGVYALDLQTGRRLGFAENDRFAICSTFKVILVAAILRSVQKGRNALDNHIPVTRADLLEYAPAVKASLGNQDRGSMSVEELCKAAIELSDNSAANLLLRQIGGPAGVTSFMRRLGDPISRLDRTETSLNENLPGDPRDTTTPAAMVGQIRVIFAGAVLNAQNRLLLERWMVDCKTGLERLRAGVPRGWIAGDKTGTGERGAANDVALFWPPQRSPILLASYISEGTADAATRNLVHKEVGRRIVAAFG